MARNFVFTSFADAEPQWSEEFSHLAYKREQCPKSGRLHWQGCLQFKKKTRKSFKTIGLILGTKCIHIEKMVATYEQALAYVRKKETAVGEPKERGDYTSQGERTDWKAAVEAKSLKQIDLGMLIKYPRGLQFARSIHSQPRDWMTECVILFGKAGSGKSMMMPRDAYWKMPGNKWWDGYDGESKVVLDDWKEEYLRRDEMLRLLDRYPLKLETKGGSVNFIARTVYITTNENPWKWYEGEDAWLRRITFISCTDFAV